MNSLYLMAVLTLLLSCEKRPQFTDSIRLGNKIVSAEVLSRGHEVYTAKCASCHGANGDGQGITHRALLVRPRNLTQGLYKFGLSAEAGLPTDEDFSKILNQGLSGTAMLPWKLSPEDTNAVTQYIKTFALAAWDEEHYVPPTRLEFSDDPFTATNKAQAIAMGKIVYHEKAQCFSCHRAYENVGDDPELYKVKPQETSYYLGKNETALLMNTPPDFLFHNVRSASNVKELYQRLSVGVTGTTMPAWSGVLSEQEIWAVAYYVDDLISQKRASLASGQVSDNSR